MMVHTCLLCAWSVFGGIRRRCKDNIKMDFRKWVGVVGTNYVSTCEPSYVISVNYRLSHPDGGSYVIRNMLE
jgi:hypothetical protein